MARKARRNPAATQRKAQGRVLRAVRRVHKTQMPSMFITTTHPGRPKTGRYDNLLPGPGSMFRQATRGEGVRAGRAERHQLTKIGRSRRTNSLSGRVRKNLGGGVGRFNMLHPRGARGRFVKKR